MFSVKVDNISGVIREDEVRKVFEHFGPVGDVHIPKAPGSNESRGFFFVRYYYEAHAKKAVRTLNGQRFHGQLMQMNLARNPPPVGAGPKSNIVGTSQIRPREREPPAPPPPPPPPPPPHRSRYPSPSEYYEEQLGRSQLERDYNGRKPLRRSPDVRVAQIGTAPPLYERDPREEQVLKHVELWHCVELGTSSRPSILNPNACNCDFCGERYDQTLPVIS